MANEVQIIEADIGSLEYHLLNWAAEHDVNPQVFMYQDEPTEYWRLPGMVMVRWNVGEEGGAIASLFLGYPDPTEIVEWWDKQNNIGRTDGE